MFDKDSSVVRSKYYSSNESKAKKFIDALYTLKMDFGNPWYMSAWYVWEYYYIKSNGDR